VFVASDVGDVYRETQTSFAIDATDDDGDGDGLPDDWEASTGAGDPDGDEDLDGLPNNCEFLLGTHPLNSDTDGGGEADGSEGYCDASETDPLDPTDDRVRSLTGLTAEAVLDGDEPAVWVRWGDALLGDFEGASISLYRRILVGDEPAGAWEFVPDGNNTAFEFYDRSVEVGPTYQYLLVPFIGIPDHPDDREVIGAAVISNAVNVSTDPYPPAGSVLINGGAATTRHLRVTLEIMADDTLGGDDGGPVEEHPGTPATELEMRISNEPGFPNAPWRPFAHIVNDWRLAEVQPGEVATVYVEFRDEAGNVSESGPGSVDTIVYAPSGQVYLPAVRRR
jgi:hypothetical protein